MRKEEIEIQGRDGHRLAGVLDLPEGEVTAYAVFAHCFTCTKDFVASRSITKELANRGIATLRFDFSGLGGSEGDFSTSGFSQNIEDLILAANTLAEQYEAPKLLVGHSLGGAAILAAAPFIPSATAVATLCAPYDPAHVQHLFEGHIEEINAEGEANVQLFGRDFAISKAFIEDINQQNQRERISRMNKALLVMHSPTDTLVGVENAKMIYDAAQHPKSFVSLDRMDHLLQDKADVAYVASVLACWASRYLDVEPKPVRAHEPKGPHDALHISPTGNGPYSLLVQTGRHRFFADEPYDLGGKDTGAAPYDFVKAGLGSCTAITVQMYASRKQWPLSNIEIDVLHEKRADEQGNKRDYFIRKIRFEGDLSDEQREKLIEIANKCPVHKTLHAGSEIETEAV